jgi:hypothetical protein
MINITHFEINISNNTALLKVSVNDIDNPRMLGLVLDSINPDNQTDVLNLVFALDWSNTEPGKSYHLENGVLTETPSSPGVTYQFDYSTNTWRDTRTQEEMWKEVRLKRDVLLKASDWTQMPDVTLTNKEAWAVYRQALRDITNQSDPFNIAWPTAPGG